MQEIQVIENLERLRVCAGLDRGRKTAAQWNDLLGLTQREWERARSHQMALPRRALERVARHFEVSPEDFETGRIDFRELSVRLAPRRELPERYRMAAFSRSRTPMTSLDFVEKVAGWRTRHRVLARLGLSESSFTDPMALISHHFITDFCAYLRGSEGFGDTHFFRMGAYSFVGNQGTLLSEVFSRFESPAQLYEFLFDEMIRYFEHNVRYRMRESRPDGCSVDLITYSDVAEAMGVRKLGNASICELKAGMMAGFTGYLGLPLAQVRHTRCVHRGDALCSYEISYAPRVTAGT